MSQLTREDLKAMTPEAIDTARIEGRLAVLLGADPDDADLIERATTEPITHADVQRLARLKRHDLIDAARTTNRIAATEETR